MEIFKTNLSNSILIILFLLVVLVTNVSAETTFFDNPNDIFIMGNSPATLTEDSGVTGGATGSGGCKHEWNCTNWSECFPSGKQTRNCINTGTCSDKYRTPEVEQNCTYTALEAGEEEKEKENIVGQNGEKEIINKDIPFLCFIITLILGFIVLYLKKDYFKKLIKRYLNKFREK